MRISKNIFRNLITYQYCFPWHKKNDYFNRKDRRKLLNSWEHALNNNKKIGVKIRLELSASSKKKYEQYPKPTKKTPKLFPDFLLSQETYRKFSLWLVSNSEKPVFTTRGFILELSTILGLFSGYVTGVSSDSGCKCSRSGL